jgi:hypothetical protein
MKNGLIISFLLASILIGNCVWAKDVVSTLDPKVKVVLIEALSEALPPYIAATDGVLKEIDALPNQLSESTRLNEIPINDLFERNGEALNKSKIWTDTDFAGGRSEHDIAWLRQSLSGLKTLLTLTQEAKAGKNVDAELDASFVNVQYTYRSENEYDLLVGLASTSRFYCNAGIVISKLKEQTNPDVSAQEYCD